MKVWTMIDPAASGICVWPQHLGSRGASREKWGLIMRHGILRVGGRLWVRLRTVAESECFKFKTCWIDPTHEFAVISPDVVYTLFQSCHTTLGSYIILKMDHTVAEFSFYVLLELKKNLIENNCLIHVELHGI